MAYPAVISLMYTMHRLRTSSRISFVSPIDEILKSAYEELDTLQNVLEDVGGCSSESEKLKALEGEIREAAFKLEDVLESLVSTQTIYQSESHPLLFSVDLQELRDVVDCFSDMAKRLAAEYRNYIDNNLLQPEEDEDEEDEDEDIISSTAYFGGNSPTKMVGFNDMFADIKNELFQDWRKHKYLPIVGMAGIGKTTLAKKILEDPLVMQKFERRFFVPVGPGSRINAMSKFYDSQRAIADQLTDDEYDSFFCNKKYLIVFDDVWGLGALRYTFKGLPPGSQIMVTTRMQNVGKYLDKRRGASNMRFMNQKESWDLLRAKVFGQEMCPPQLEKAGKKIAVNCEGLPLLIVKIADLLTKADKTPEHWEKVATDNQNSFFEEAYDLLLDVLCPSYYLLRPKEKSCFLHMAVFPPNYKVFRSRLFNLWHAEGFVYSERDFERCLMHVVEANVVVVHLEGSNLNTKVFSLHSVFWYLSKKEAGNYKFLHILNKYADAFSEGIESQRRLSIYKNVLFCITDVYNSVASVSNARSLLCTGVHHPYQVPICFGSLRLLRVLDALTIRFYEFPMEVLELVLLRYLALTSNENLPSSISKLWNLQYLIVHQHLCINFTLVESYLPVEVWHLQELEHLEIPGRNLPDPPPGVALQNLLKLIDVGRHSCTENVLKSVPNLKKLRVNIELTPHVVEPFNFDHIYHLSQPKSLQFVIVNPEIVAPPPPPPLPVFGSHLTKLTLSGFGYPWEDLNKIAHLPLEVLKLQSYAFRGERWVSKENDFHNLRHLSIEDTDLVEWTYGWRCNPFQNLRHLTMKNCYKLQSFHVFQVVELVDCSSSAVAYAKMRTRKLGYQLYVASSWENDNLNS